MRVQDQQVLAGDQRVADLEALILVAGDAMLDGKILQLSAIEIRIGTLSVTLCFRVQEF